MKYLSLFSGIGEFECGIQNSKYKNELECIGFSEVDKYATSIYKKHFPEHRELGDVSKIRTEELPDFDLLVGGFPCQAFSIAGKRRGFDDTRGTLFFEIARILKNKTPKYFLLENVKGLLSHDKGRTFKKILEVLSDLGYDVQWEVLNSKNFQVPQNRERIFIKGYFREKCGGEVLSFGRKSKETNAKVNSYRDSSRTYSIYDNGETLARTLTGEGQNNGNRHLIKEEPKVNVVGNFSPSNHHGKNVYDSKGLAPTLCANSLYKNGLNILEENKNKEEVKVKCVGSTNGHQSGNCYDSNGLSPSLCATDYKSPIKIVCENIKVPVTHRKYEVNVKKLQDTLRNHRNKSNLTVKDIANKLGIKKTTVDHYFRSDESFAIPNPDIWFKLKKILNIDSDEFDKSITEFVEVEGVYDSRERIYSENGLCPTLSTNCKNYLIKLNNNYETNSNNTGDSQLIPLNNAPQAQKIYSVDGISCTLSANGGGDGGKTGLYDVTDYDNHVERFEGHNVVSVSDNEVATTTKNGDFFAVTTRPRNMPLKKCQDNYVIEKCYGSTQKHRAETDGTYSPTLTSAMGNGGGHVPMIEIKKQDPVHVHGSNQAHRSITDGTYCPTLNCHRTPMVEFNNYRIRRLTPLECERLQGFPDNWTSKGVDEKADEVKISDTQRYKCCGNAVTTNVITYIFNEWNLK